LPIHEHRASNVTFPAEARTEELRDTIERVKLKLVGFLEQCGDEPGREDGFDYLKYENLPETKV
jgi:hypothetical protein